MRRDRACPVPTMTAIPTNALSLRSGQQRYHPTTYPGNSAPVEAVSRTPFYNLPRGRHTFRFFKQGFREEEIMLDVQQEKVVDVILQPGQSQTRLALSGWIIIDSEPRGAEVYLNDQRVGTTPYRMPCP